MIALDTNIIVYAHRVEMPFHPEAAASLRTLAESGDPWALPWPVIHEFLAVTTNARIFRDPTPCEEAILFLKTLMEAPSLRLLAEGVGYLDTLEHLLLATHTGGARVHDARIAAICKYHHVRELWSADRDFSRYSGIRVVNPLS